MTPAPRRKRHWYGEGRTINQKGTMTLDEQRVLRRLLHRCLDGGGRVESDRVRSRLMAFCSRVERVCEQAYKEFDRKGMHYGWYFSLKSTAQEAQDYKTLIKKGML